MTVREDLEARIRDGYEIIQEYRVMIQQGSSPKERMRCRREIQQQWELIDEYVHEYEKLEPNRGHWPTDIYEISTHFSDVPPPYETGPATPGRTEINVMTWNIAGAKMFHHLDFPPDNAASSYIAAYHNAWLQVMSSLLETSDGRRYPDIILLQECIGFQDTRANPSGRWPSGKRILQEIFRGYECFFFPALSSRTHPHPGKWQAYTLGHIRNFIPEYIEAQQGYGICIRDPSTLRKLWIQEEDTDRISHLSDIPGSDFALCFGVVNAVPGLYLGNRNTEPRLMVMGRLKMGSPDAPRYVNFCNVHLTTLRGEREGKPAIDLEARKLRLEQIDLLVKHIISAYQEIEAYRTPRPAEQSREDIWILGGDFNALPDSHEIRMLQEAGFVIGNQDWRIVDPSGTYAERTGTKWSLDDPRKEPIVVDYVLCGLKLTSFYPTLLDTSDSQPPFRPQFDDTRFESDHAVVFASFKI